MNCSVIQQPCFLPRVSSPFQNKHGKVDILTEKKIKHLYLNFYLIFFFIFKINVYLNASITIIPYRFTFWLVQLALPHFAEYYLSTESAQSTILCFEAFFLLEYFFLLFIVLYSSLPFVCHFSQRKLWKVTLQEPLVPETQPQSFASQCLTPLLSSALRAHVAAEWASSVGSEEWRNLLFSSFLSPLPVCLAFCPFPRLTEKPAKKTRHLDATRLQKKNRKQRPLISSDYVQRLKPHGSNPEFLTRVPPLSKLLQGLLLFFIPFRFWANNVSHQHLCCLLSIPKFVQLELQPDSKTRCILLTVTPLSLVAYINTLKIW